MSLTVHINPRIGQILRQYRKRTGMTQQALGETLDQVLASRGAAFGTGFSKSTISRIEKGLFLPPQNKLEILCQLLEIPPAETQELFTLCGYTPLLNPDSLPTRIDLLARQVQEQPRDMLSWLELVSLLNQERQFNTMQQRVSEALLQLDTEPESWSGVVRAALLAKQQLGLALAATGHEELNALRLSEQFIQQGLKLFKTFQKTLPAEMAVGLRIELLRSQLAVNYRQLMRELDEMPADQLQERFAGLEALLQEISRFIERLPASERRLEFNLYLHRERVSLELKRIECLEYLQFQSGLLRFWPEVSSLCTQDERVLAVMARVLAPGERQERELLEGLFTLRQGRLDIPGGGPRNDLGQLRQELDAFLAAQQQQLQHGQSPEQLPATGVLNTLLCYVAALARLETFAQEGELLLKGLYLLTSHQTLSAWQYVTACFYACRYLMHRRLPDLDACLAAWLGWCQSPGPEHSNYNLHRFRSLLSEPCLWVTCLSGLGRQEWQSVYRAWLEPRLNDLLSSQERVV